MIPIPFYGWLDDTEKKPLTEQEILLQAQDVFIHGENKAIIEFARKIELAHGIY